MMNEQELKQLKNDLDELKRIYAELDENIIRTFPKDLLEKLAWCMLDYTKFSEDFIRDYADYVDWTRVSIDMKLSESFIREFSDKVDWYFISYYQVMSDKLLNDFESRINWMGYLSASSASNNMTKKNAREIL